MNNIFVNQDLYAALKGRFGGEDEIKQVRAITQKEIEFLRDCGITYNSASHSIGELKKTITENSDRVWVDRCKEVSVEINVVELMAKIPELLDLFRQIVGQVHYELLMNVLRNAFTLKIDSQHGSNSDWDIFAFRKTAEGEWFVAIFRIEAFRVANEWDFVFFKLGKNAIKVNFLGYHLRKIENATLDRLVLTPRNEVNFRIDENEWGTRHLTTVDDLR